MGQQEDRVELERLQALHSYNILDTPAEIEFDDLTCLAAKFCQTPIALISLLDRDRQWFKSRVGIVTHQLPRSTAFCHYAIQGNGPLVVEDAHLDQRFATNPLVTGDPHIRFYAGVPLTTRQGYRLGTLCVIDRVARQITAEQMGVLQALGRQVVSQLELKRNNAILLERENYLQAIVQTEPECIKLMDATGQLLDINPAGLSMIGVSHKSEVIGKSVYSLIAPEHQLVFQQFNQAICSGNPGSLSFDLITLNGHRRSLETHAVPLRNTQGETVHLAITRDITVQNQSFQAMQVGLKNLADIKFALDQSAIVDITDSDGLILDVNDKFCQISQYSKSELVGQTHQITNADYHPPDFFEQMWQTITQGQVWRGEIKNKAKHGSFYWVDTTIVPFLGAHGEVCQYIAIRYDVTERKLAEFALKQQRDREKLVTAIAQKIRPYVDLTEILSTVVEEVQQLLQADRALIYRTHQDGTGEIMAEAVAPGCTAIINQALPVDIFPLECYETYQMGRVRRVVDVEQDPMSACLRETMRQLSVRSKLVVPILHENSLWGLLVAHQSSHPRSWESWESDLLLQLATQIGIAVHQAALYQRLFIEARYDSLTGLPNRRFLMEHLKLALERLQAPAHQQFSILYLDLDYFKIINDSLGHFWGDRLLARIARQLSKMIAATDFVARLGGDEFVIFVEEKIPQTRAIDLANQIIKHLKQPIKMNGYELFVTASIGVLPVTTSYKDSQELMRDADIAMYRAKANGKNCYAIFTPPMHLSVLKRLNLENDLRQALDRQELSLRYQPIVMLKTGKIVGFEALLRWEHPVQGIISPADFIPIAEEIGLINRIGLWALEQACHQMAIWQETHGCQQLKMSVNLSPLQLKDPKIVEQILNALATNRLSPEQLTLEITESLLVDNFLATVNLLKDLRFHGIQISIDDFGTGYSSLSYLHRMPVDILKIDKSFIHHRCHDDYNYNIIKTIISLGEQLGLSVIAEGIETPEQLQELIRLGCIQGQGYWFSKPLLPEAIDLLL